MKETILTGIRANNDLQIGNYFGAILPTIKLAQNHANEYNVNLFIPDLHSFTTPINHAELYDSIINNAIVYAAAGLPIDHESVYVYRQSHIPAHSELTWILDCFTGFGEMSRMTQFKDKSTKLGDQQISVGLFNYPVLMAADILLYNARYVPVGEDQTQHLEFTRDIATRINNRFGEIFRVPESVAEQNKFFGRSHGAKIKDLIDPTKKMSKSDETGRGVVFLTDTPEQAHKKVMSATTDSLASIHYDAQNQPGITNLINILALIKNQSPAEVSAQFEGQSRYGDFKQIVADAVAEFLRDFQSRLQNVNREQILAKLESSETEAATTANETLYRVQKAIGLR